jgi:hypothetical protein
MLMSMQMPSDDNSNELDNKPKRKVKPQVDQSEALSQLYEYVIWCGNAINQLNVIVAQLQQGQYQQQYTPYQEVPPVVEEAPVNPNTPTFSKRVKPLIEEEPVKPLAKPWYKQKGIVFSIILGVAMIYLIYLFWMRSTGHSVTIPGVGKF